MGRPRAALCISKAYSESDRMESLRLIVPPAQEPVLLADLKNLMEIPASDTTHDSTLTAFLVAAREDCENYTRTKLVTQTWLLRTDSFPTVSLRYDRNGYPQYQLPFPPFQSVDSFEYVDTSGTVQTLTRDTTYGTNPAEPFYGYQLEPGGDTIPARLLPPWARPWPPQRMVPANTMIQFRCGYGGPVTASIEAGSAALSAPNFTFNPDDAAVMSGDTGIRVCVPGAGNGKGPLITNVASVDDNGNATLAAQAAYSVQNAQAWVGQPVPENLKLSIMFHAQFFFEQGAVVDQAVPRVVTALRNSYRNLVS
jgi:hypothetical protein